MKKIRSWWHGAEVCRREVVIAEPVAEQVEPSDTRHGVLGFAGRNIDAARRDESRPGEGRDVA